jgi:hypothetical protein
MRGTWPFAVSRDRFCPKRDAAGWLRVTAAAISFPAAWSALHAEALATGQRLHPKLVRIPGHPNPSGWRVHSRMCGSMPLQTNGSLNAEPRPAPDQSNRNPAPSATACAGIGIVRQRNMSGRTDRRAAGLRRSTSMTIVGGSEIVQSRPSCRATARAVATRQRFPSLFAAGCELVYSTVEPFWRALIIRLGWRSNSRFEQDRSSGSIGARFRRWSSHAARQAATAPPENSHGAPHAIQ